MNVPVKALRAIREQINELLAEFDDEPSPLTFPLTLTEPKLKKGERYISTVISADGSRREHLILLPGDNDDANWQTQMEWAASIGGELFDRVVGALLFATMPEQFQKAVYWTCEQHAATPSYAWYQDFDLGSQFNSFKGNKLRARAVRRSPIE